MVAFAANSVLCRLALKTAAISPAGFTIIRLVAGAVVLWAILALRRRNHVSGGSWAGAVSLFVYAAAFSFAYVSLPAGTGALLLFGAVQVTMIAWGFRFGERMSPLQSVGFALALSGIVLLMLPGLSAPPLAGAALMIVAGVAWGVYSLLGRREDNPLAATSANFMRTVALAFGLALLGWEGLKWDGIGVVYAVLSGGVASGVGYAIWYAALRGLSATQAATVQLSVPVIAALGGVWFLTEPITWRLAVSATLTLGGIALVLRKKGS